MELGIPLLIWFLLCAATGLRAFNSENRRKDFQYDDYQPWNYKVDYNADNIFPDSDYPSYRREDNYFPDKGRYYGRKEDGSNDRKNVVKPVVVKCKAKIDLGFIIDSSQSIKRHYQNEKDFVKSLAAKFSVGKNDSRAGVITFSARAEYSIKLNDYSDLSSFDAAVDAIPLMDSVTRIDKALRLTQKEMFTAANGARSGLPKILVLLTDGSQTKSSRAENPAAIAKELRKSGVILIVIGMGIGVEPNELALLAGGRNKMFTAASFKYLLSDKFMKSVQDKACAAVGGRKTCERDRPQDCADVYVDGDNLVRDEVHCLIKPVHPSLGRIGDSVVVPATFISPSKVRCTLPKIGMCGDKLAQVIFEIKLINGKNPDDASDEAFEYEVVDKKCYSCGADNICTQVAGCVVKNCCYNDGDPERPTECSNCVGPSLKFEKANGGCSLSSYYCKSNTLLPAPVVQRPQVLVQEDCATKCCNFPQCSSFDFNKRSKTCRLFKKSWLNTVTSKTGTTHCQRKGGCSLSSYDCKSNTYLRDWTLKKYNKIKVQEDCATKCCNFPQCFRFDFRRSGRCILFKKSIAAPTVSTLGTKHCQKKGKVSGTDGCFATCGGRGGYCPDVCGKHALCCRQGYVDCPLALSEVAPSNDHACITTPFNNTGLDVKGCSSVRDCGDKNGGCEDKCDDTGGTHVCKCSATGKIVGKDGTSCIRDCGNKNGGCEDKCSDTGGAHICKCTATGKIVGTDGTSCVRDCGFKNGGCEDKCDDSGVAHICKCTATGKIVGKDGTSCVRDCGNKNGGCEDKCDDTGDAHICKCTATGKIVGTDGKSCVRDCGNKNGGCEDKCDDTGGAHICKCTATGKIVGTDGTSCVRDCGNKNGGCEDKCDDTGGAHICKCTATGKIVGKDGSSCVRNCGIKNGGCEDICDDSGDAHICKCTASGKIVGKDGSSCECSNFVCTKKCKIGFKKDENGCKICQCKKATHGHTTHTKITITVHTSGDGKNAPHLSLQISLNPQLQQSRFVPESCYAGAPSAVNPGRFYLIRNRFPTLRSHVQYTPTTFNLSSNAAEAKRIMEFLQSIERPHVRCKLRICPLPSNSCNFGYRSRPAKENLFERIVKETLRKERLNDLKEESKIEEPDEYQEDEIVYVNAELLKA